MTRSQQPVLQQPDRDHPAERPGLPDPRVTPTISVIEAGAFLGVCKQSAYNAAHSGEIPTIRVGRQLRVPTAAFLRLLGVGPDRADAMSTGIRRQADAAG